MTANCSKIIYTNTLYVFRFDKIIRFIKLWIICNLHIDYCVIVINIYASIVVLEFPQNFFIRFKKNQIMFTNVIKFVLMHKLFNVY